MKRLAFLFLVVMIAAAGCSYPVTKVNTVDSRPTLSFKGAPEGSQVIVDGLNMGIASQFDGKPEVLVIEPGTHEIEIKQNNQTIFQQTVFVESEHKVINVR